MLPATMERWVRHTTSSEPMRACSPNKWVFTWTKIFSGPHKYYVFRYLNREKAAGRATNSRENETQKHNGHALGLIGTGGAIIVTLDNCRSFVRGECELRPYALAYGTDSTHSRCRSSDYCIEVVEYVSKD